MPCPSRTRQPIRRTVSAPLIGVAAGIVAIIIAAATSGCGLGKTPEASADNGADLLRRLEDESWYSVSIQDQRMGYAYIASRIREAGGETLLAITQKTAFKIEHLGMKLGAESTQTVLYGPDLRPREYVLDSDQLGQKVALRAVVKGQQLEVHTTRGGSTTEKLLELGENFGGEVEVARRMIESDLKSGDTFSFQVFIPELGALDELSVEIGEHADIAHEGATVRALEVRQQSKSLGFETTAWIDPRGVAFKMAVPGLLGGITLLRVDEEEALAELSPLKLVSNIPIGATIAEPRKVRRLVLNATASGSGLADLIPSDERQQVKPDPAISTEGEIVLASVAAPETALKLPITDAALKPWLASTEFAESQDPDIVALSKQIVGDETDAWEAARKLTMWVYDNMGKVKSEPAPITATQCLQQKSGDCSEHAVLLTALARAAGVPTKFCTGLVYAKGAFYYHAWNEVYVGKWVAVDPSWGELVVDATHLKISEAALDAKSFARSCLATGRTMGALELSLVEYENEGGEVVKPEASADKPPT